jgi:hypothetical protein
MNLSPIQRPVSQVSDFALNLLDEINPKCRTFSELMEELLEKLPEHFIDNLEQVDRDKAGRQLRGSLGSLVRRGLIIKNGDSFCSSAFSSAGGNDNRKSRKVVPSTNHGGHEVDKDVPSFTPYEEVEEVIIRTGAMEICLKPDKGKNLRVIVLK